MSKGVGNGDRKASPQISVSTVVTDGASFRRGLEMIAQAGATAVEPAYIDGYMPFDETTFSERNGNALAAAAADAGLALRALSAHMDLGRAESAGKLLRRLDFAAAAGASILISNATTLERRATFEARLGGVLDAFASTGVTLAIENPGHGADALLPAGQESARIVAAIAHPNLRLNYDIGNALTYGGRKADALDDLKAALPFSAHIHLKDVRESGADWVYCPIGEGAVNYDHQVFGAIREAGIPVGIEHPIRLRRPGRGDPVRQARAPSSSEVVTAVRRSLGFVRTHLARPDIQVSSPDGPSRQ